MEATFLGPTSSLEKLLITDWSMTYPVPNQNFILFQFLIAGFAKSSDF
jgi:hypothetical protein